MEQQEKLTVLLIEPECYPKTIEIEPGLEPLQKAVGGWIEAVYPWEDKAAIIVNEEGKLDQLPLNRALRTEDGEIYDITAGNMVIVGLGEEDFSSLTKDQLAHYEKLFHQPETFIRLGGHLMAIPIPDKEVRKTERERKQELKKDSGYGDAYVQTAQYLDWFEKAPISKGKRVYGIICLNSPTQTLISKVRNDQRMRLFEYQISYTEIK